MDDDLYAADVPQLSPLSRLPHELLRMVACYLSTRDFCALRLASQHISSVLRVFLAQPDFLGEPWLDNAARLEGLSRLPECAQRIRRVRVRSRALYEDEEQMAWDETCPDPAPRLLPGAASTTRADQRAVVPLRADLLSEGLARLPRLQELELRWERAPFMAREDMGLGAAGLAEVDDEVARQLAFTTGGWQVELLVDLAADMAPLRALTLAPLALEAMDPVGYLPLVANLFHSLEVLDVALCGRAVRSTPGLLGRLDEVLASAWVLRELRLDLGDDGGSPRERRRFQDFLLRTTLGKLEVLRLSHAAPKLHDLIAFLRRHAGTLRSLELYDVRGARPRNRPPEQGGGGTLLVLPSWDDVFRMVHDELQGLTDVKVRGYFADHENEIYFEGREGEEEEAVVYADEVMGMVLTEEEEILRYVEGTQHVDVRPLERYLVRQGRLPKIEWRPLEME